MFCATHPNVRGRNYVRPVMGIVLVVMLYTFQTLAILENGMMLCNACGAWPCRRPGDILRNHIIRPGTLETNDNSQPKIKSMARVSRPRILISEWTKWQYIQGDYCAGDSWSL